MNASVKGSVALKSIFPAAALVATLFLTAGPGLHAEDYDRCRHSIIHREHVLHESIERYGRHSPEADHQRHALHAVRERCWREYHRWWDEHEHRWHTERDWDEHDHDHD
jgi:hypothetical protein